MTVGTGRADTGTPGSRGDNNQRQQLSAPHARRGQVTRPHDEPVDGPCGVRGLPTAPPADAYGLTRFACRKTFAMEIKSNLLKTNQ